ncbi:myocardin-related transcription factor B [Anastrepha ludens]|uniref:myocardin-related transcription factor B n=1 Tax=Anastrepha ludens TaxID=28586 RepID=UPI0023B19489|nr:myocardin-related transcription factor B [Anastrepha ludens]
MSEGEQCLNAVAAAAAAAVAAPPSFLCGGGGISSDDGTNSDAYDPRQSPPKAIVDSSPLQPAMDKNKESLKTSPAIHEQCKQLERAKTSDLLKAKIQQRPNREDLERRHILEEDECHIDPSLAEKQRMLKKARLADQLNSQIQHRPGPLELIKKNILHTEKPIEKIVKEGLVSFKATSEGLLTRPQHPHSYVTYEEDSQSSESDTRQTPPRVDEICASGQSDALQAAAASAGIVTVALTIPTSGGQVVVTSAPLLPSSTPATKISTVPPPPPPPPAPMVCNIQVKQETANLFEELCQSVAGPTASPGGNFLPMVSSPGSLTSAASTLSPLSSIASPSQSLTPLPPLSCQLSLGKSDAPGKEKNRKKSKSKPACKARTIKFHEYKGPPNAAQKMSCSESSQPEETSYQLMLEQQNCLLKFLETLNKNQSIVPATTGATVSTSSNVNTVGGLVTTVAKSNAVASTTASSAAKMSTALPSPAPATPLSNITAVGDSASNTASPANSTFSMISTPRPPPLPSPALSVTSSIPPSPATSYADSTCSTTDISRLEKMKVSDLKMHLKRRNLPVSGPKPQLIERLKPFLPLDATECSTIVNTPASTASSELISSSVGEAMDATNSAVTDVPVAMIVNSPHTVAMSPERHNLEPEQMDIVQQADSPRPVPFQTILQPKPQAATIILTNDDLVREQKRQIDELQRQLQRSQQELKQMRQKQQQTNQQQKQLLHPQKQTVTAQVVNALPTQQITLITTTTGPHCAPLTVLPQIKENITLPTKATVKSQATKANAANAAAHKANTNNTTTVTPQAMSQKMVVKQQLEAKIQKQKQAAAAAAAAAASQQAQKHVQQVQAHALAQAQAQAHAQLRLLTTTQKTQTLLIPTVTATQKIEDKKLPTAARQKNSINTNSKGNNANSNTNGTTTTILANQIPLTAKTHNNLGLVWNEGNQTIFLVGLNDQHMTAHTIGNISLANASPATKKLLNGHQRTSSLPSILLPITTPQGHEPQQLIEAKPVITQQQLQQLQLQHQQQQQYHNHTFLPTQQIIQLDIKPQTQPPPPPPPPQYEEATKKLAAKASLAQVKIKEEPNTGRNTPQTQINSVTTQTTSKRKNAVKSEKVTDVLDILVKQGELPESVLEPITPVTPLTPGGGNALMTDMSGNLIFNTSSSGSGPSDDLAASGALVPKQEPQTSPMPDSTLVSQPMDTTPCGQQQSQMQQTQQQRAESDIDRVFQMLSSDGDVPSSSINSPLTSGFIENIDMASPMQPDAHIDAASVAKSLGIFLEQHHSTPPPQTSATGISLHQHHQHHQQHQHQSPTHHDMLSKATSSPEKSMARNMGSPDAKLNHFDEFELLELMSQQLEMDIGDDTSNFAGTVDVGVNSVAHHHQHLRHSNDDCKSGNNVDSSANVGAQNLNGLRRDMNPSLQPSINELIQQQLHHHSHQQPYHQLQHNNNNSGDVMSAVDVDFDAESFVAQLAQVSSHDGMANNNNNLSHNRSILGGIGGGEHGSRGSPHNNNCHSSNSSEVSSSGDHLTNVRGHSHSSSNNHFSATPMDVCDDFDNPLGSFSFSAFSPDSNINTPPHPFGSSDGSSSSAILNGGCINGETNMGLGLSGDMVSGVGAAPSASATCGMQANNAMGVGEQMSICGIANGLGEGNAMLGGSGGDGVMGESSVTATGSDSFGAAGDIFDLFNMDDYKMSWGEGDFAV